MGPASEYEDGVKGHKFASYQLILKDKNSDVSQKKMPLSEDFFLYAFFRARVKYEAKSLLEWLICETKARLPGTRIPNISRNDPTSHVSKLTLPCI